jgi:voltage-gated potassium channel
MILQHYNQRPRSEGGEPTDKQSRDREVEVDMGIGYDELVRTEPWRRKLLSVLYHPYTELTIFALILASIGLLVAEVTVSDDTSGGWMGLLMGRAHGTFFWVDVFITACFVVEYLLKLIVAPNKRYFFRANIIDLLALLPIMRIFRLGRAVRLFRLLRMLRVMRVGAVLEQRIESVSAESQKFRVENTVIAVYMFFSLVFGTVGIMVFEKGQDSGFETLGDGLWWCVVTITTVGYGDISPSTAGGKVVAGIIMFIGLSFYALLTSSISSILIDRAGHNEGNELAVSTLEHHVVICGWNEHAFGLLQDLFARSAPPPVVVLTDSDSVPQIQHGGLHFIYADPSTPGGLARARVRHADVVVVLPELRDGMAEQDADARTILTVLAVEQLRPQVHTIAQLLNPENAFHAHNAGVDELLSAEVFTGAMLSQAVQSPGITDVYQQLFQPDGTTLRTIALPEDLRGQGFLDAAEALSRASSHLLIGLRRGEALIMDPDSDLRLEADDVLIVLAPSRDQHSET